MGSFFSLFSDREPVPPQYQVYINFRGDELRNGFIDLLVDALNEANVNAFIDHNELRGTRLNHLFTAIEESRIALTIFSRRYTESDCCLNELVKIKECMDQGNLQVIPIFFNVEPRDVRRLMGPFGDNFRNLAFRFQGFSGRTQRWNEALQSISRMFGLSSSEFRQQSHLVRSIVDEVNRTLIDIASNEEIVADSQRNNLAGRMKEVIKYVIRYLTLILFLTLAVGPYLFVILCLLAFYFRSF